MKSTYKLFGAYWDGMKSVKVDVLQKDSSPVQPSELISFQKLLSVQDKTDLDRIVITYNKDESVAFGIDYWAETANPVLRDFLEKRLGQMVAHLSVKFPAVHCVKV
ncbi:MAG: hypothetical protein K6B52_00560 [Clostridiales bacterium]|nr:hypothetical protein [Clostridiales bacterium]